MTEDLRRTIREMVDACSTLPGRSSISGRPAAARLTQHDLDALCRTAETGEQWAEICRLEAVMLAQQRRRRPEGECATCDKYGDEPLFPSHTASENCESGKHPHCSCDICF